MKPLDPQIRRLLDEVSSGDLPPAHLEDELWQQLAPRLGGALPPTAAAASSTLAAKSGVFLASSPVLKLSLAALVAGASVTAVVQHRSAVPEPRQHVSAAIEQRSPAQQEIAAPSIAAPHQPAEAPQNVPAAQPQSVPSASANRATASARNARAPAANSGSTLVAETQLLARAQRAMRNGKPAQALPLIEQHASAYPKGTLAQERDAARVFALCALARHDEARRSQQQFLKTWPGSPLTERVQRACTPSTTTR